MNHAPIALLFCLPLFAVAQEEIRLDPEQKPAPAGLTRPNPGLDKGIIRIEGHLLKPVQTQSPLSAGNSPQTRTNSEARSNSAYSDPLARKSWSFTLPAMSGGFDSFSEVRSWARPVKESSTGKSIVYSNTAPVTDDGKKPGEKIEPAAAGFNTRFQWLERDRRYFLLEYTVTPNQ